MSIGVNSRATRSLATAMTNPWGRARWLPVVTGLYVLWSLIPVGIAVLFSFNAGRSRSTWQGFSTRWYVGDPAAAESVLYDQSLRFALAQSLRLAVLTMLVGAVLAVTQTDIKRLLAYSSIANAGYLLVGVLALSKDGLSSTMFYLVAYGFTVIAAFGIVTLVRDADGEATHLSRWAGLGRRSPLFAGTFTFILLAFAGIPLTSGFVAKFAVFGAAIDQKIVPLDTLLSTGPAAGPEFTNRFNLFRSAELTGVPAEGYSSTQALDALEATAREVLPPDMSFDWADMSFQERRAPGVAVVFGLAIFLVFLILAAQYESWGLPFSVLLGTPFAAFGAYLGLWLARQYLGESYVNNVFAQIGLIMLIGLAAKNAILIVEFAKAEHEQGKSLVEAALSSARLRLRPILMTAFAFILGVVPLLTATGAGAESRKVMGMVVFSGMLIATILGVLLIPMLYVAVERVIGGEVLDDMQLQPCVSGEQWTWDGVRFSLWRWAGGQSSNDRSCVLLVEAQGERLLLAGDMEAGAERAWLAATGAPRIDWLQSPHHGSRSSSSISSMDQSPTRLP